MKKSQPIRMCITCRDRHPQNSLLRLKHKSKSIVKFDGQGRSFYLCVDCSVNMKKIKGLSRRFDQNEEALLGVIKELTVKS